MPKCIRNSAMRIYKFDMIRKNIFWANLLGIEEDGFFVENNNDTVDYCDDEIKEEHAKTIIEMANQSMRIDDTKWYCNNKLEKLIINDIFSKLDNNKEYHYNFKMFRNRDKNIYLFYLNHEEFTCYGIIKLGSNIYHKLVGMKNAHPFIDTSFFHYANSDGSGPNKFVINGKINSRKILKKMNLYYNRFLKDTYH